MLHIGSYILVSHFPFLQESTTDVVVVMEHLNQRKSSEQVAANVSFYFGNLCQCIEGAKNRIILVNEGPDEEGR